MANFGFRLAYSTSPRLAARDPWSPLGRGLVLSEMLGIAGFDEKIAGLAGMNLVEWDRVRTDWLTITVNTNTDEMPMISVTA